MTQNDRRAGILLPVFSLPSPYGIGTFGKEAYEFADHLKKAGQAFWQILPIGPTGYGDSPYQSFSTYAGNPYFIDPDMLKQEELLTEEDISAFEWGSAPNYIDYGLLYKNRYPLLEKAFSRFRPGAEYKSFLEKEEPWLLDYTRYMNKKDGRGESFYCFVQYEFFKQWFALKKYVNSLGIRIIGDLPIYVAMDSADVMADKRLFQFAADGKPLAVAGCPPDPFAADGQLWGNPLYDWDYHEKTGFQWWICRLRHCFRLYDVVRIDHFRGIDEYYAIPYDSTSARIGMWKKGPGMELLNALKQAVGDMPVIAEDLGFLTPSVEKLVKDSGFPGMKVLEFSFDSRDDAKDLPDTWRRNAVAYTGTHDNQTIKSWFTELTEQDQAYAADYLKKTVPEVIAEDYVYTFIRVTMNSAADTAVIPLHDYKRLGSEARINVPATCGGNWRWRFTNTIFCDNVWNEILAVTTESGRTVRRG